MAGPDDGVPEGVPSRGETAALVEAEQLDRAEQDVAEAEARMREWVRTRRTYEARRAQCRGWSTRDQSSRARFTSPISTAQKNVHSAFFTSTSHSSGRWLVKPGS